MCELRVNGRSVDVVGRITVLNLLTAYLLVPSLYKYDVESNNRKAEASRVCIPKAAGPLQGPFRAFIWPWMRPWACSGGVVASVSDSRETQ